MLKLIDERLKKLNLQEDSYEVCTERCMHLELKIAYLEMLNKDSYV